MLSFITVGVGLKRGLAKATTTKAEFGAKRQDPMAKAIKSRIVVPHQVGGAEATSG